MMKLHAVLKGVPGLERPKHHYSNFESEMKQWAALTLDKFPKEKFPNAAVEMYAVEERLLKTFLHAEESQ